MSKAHTLTSTHRVVS